MKNIRFSDFFTFSEDLTLEKSNGANRLGTMRLLDITCGIETQPEYLLEIDAIKHTLSKLPPKAYTRGKLELGFLIAFIKEIVKLINNNISAIKEKGRVMTQTEISEHNAIEILGPRVPIPPSLQKFLQNNVA